MRTLPRNLNDTPTRRSEKRPSHNTFTTMVTTNSSTNNIHPNIQMARDTRAQAQAKRMEYHPQMLKKKQQPQQPQQQQQQQQQMVEDLQFFQELEVQEDAHPHSSNAIFFSEDPSPSKMNSTTPSTTKMMAPTSSTSPQTGTSSTHIINNNNKSPPASIIEHKALLQQLQHQITFLTTQQEQYLVQIESLKSHNIDLQASLQSMMDIHPPNGTTSTKVSSSDAYKKALRLQSDLLDSKNLLQEEVSRRERAEMNLDCLKLEMEDQKVRSEKKIQELEGMLEERMKDLDDGVNLMKGLEDEILEIKALLEEEEKKNDQFLEQFQQFEKERDELVEGLTNQMKDHQENMTRLEERFQTEKLELEEQCLKLQEEIEQMKERVKEMEKKRRLKDEMMDELQDLQDDMEATIRNMQAIDEEKEEKIAELEHFVGTLEKDLQDSHEKVRSMEDVVTKYNQRSRQEMQDYAAELEEARRNERQAREESEEYLSKLKDAQDEIELLCSEMETVHIELDQKRAYAEEAEKQIASLSESIKNTSTDKAKQHQYMRDRKKWSMTEKALRQELEEVQHEFSKYKEEHAHIMAERDELNKECFKMDDENAYMKEQVQSLQAKVNEYCSLLEQKEAESMNQIKSLEKELYRTQQQASGSSSSLSPPSLARSRELDALKKEMLQKDQEIESLKKMLKDDRNELFKLKDWLSTEPSFPSTKNIAKKDFPEKSRTTNSSHAKKTSEPFNAFVHDDDEDDFDHQDDTQPIKEFTSTPDDLDWDEMDDHMTARRRPIASNLFHDKQGMVTPEDERKERASIENDAVRRYMRQRRKNY